MGAKDKIKFAKKNATSSYVNFFSSDVPDDRRRYILKFMIKGTGSADTLTIAKVERDDSQTEFFDKYVNANTNIETPTGAPDPEKPLLVLEGGTNLALKSGGQAISVTVIYYDNEIA